jgi:hypothetical protein
LCHLVAQIRQEYKDHHRRIHHILIGSYDFAEFKISKIGNALKHTEAKFVALSKAAKELKFVFKSWRLSMHHRYITMSKEDNRITFYPSPMGTPPKNCQDNNIFALTGLVMGNQLPRMVICPLSFWSKGQMK